VTYVDYKDTARLRKFVSDRGKIRARRVTGTARSISATSDGGQNAREVALLPYTSSTR